MPDRDDRYAAVSILNVMEKPVGTNRYLPNVLTPQLLKSFAHVGKLTEQKGFAQDDLTHAHGGASRRSEGKAGSKLDSLLM